MFRENEQEDRWIECVEEVFNRPPPEVAADIPPAEVDSEVKSLKKGNAPGLDNLGPELFNAHPVVAASILQQLFYEIWKGERILEEWSKNLIGLKFRRKKTEVMTINVSNP